MTRLFVCKLLIIVAGACAGFLVIYGRKTTNPHGFATVANRPFPWEYERSGGEDVAYVRFLRCLPLKLRGTKVQYYTGGDVRFQSLKYAVVDIPFLSNAEQCSDVCMGLKAEYLYHAGLYGRICFQNVNGKMQNYRGGLSKISFERYLRNPYSVASTYSPSREMKAGRLADMEPGDVFVYLAWYGQKYGHAMMVDVAVNKRS